MRDTTSESKVHLKTALHEMNYLNNRETTNNKL